MPENWNLSTKGLGLGGMRNAFLEGLNPGHGRAAGELGDEGIDLVAEILDADFAGEKAVCGEVAQEGEEFHRVLESLILPGVFAVSDEVEDFGLLLRSGVEPSLAITSGAGGIEPLQAVAQGL